VQNGEIFLPDLMESISASGRENSPLQGSRRHAGPWVGANSNFENLKFWAGRTRSGCFTEDGKMPDDSDRKSGI